ncbi:MAG: hypothetical protein ACOYNS_11290 [Bacteroidota bacterium]
MRYSALLILLLLFCSSCQKKKAAEPSVQREEHYVPPATEEEIDVSQTYLSPSDGLSDRSAFIPSVFEKKELKYRGSRNIYYIVSRPKNSSVTLVVEYLSGRFANGDTVSTATRLLLFSDDVLVYRKAFQIQFDGPSNFSSVRKFDHSLMNISAARSILFYWNENVSEDGMSVKEYAAAAVDKDGLTNELSGDISRIGGSVTTVRFLNENRLKAKIAPNHRYLSLSVEVFYTVDWQAYTAVMDVPVDTIFSVSEQPSHFFSSKIKLFAQPQTNSAFRETNFRRLTQAQMQRLFVPSLFDTNSISRDHLFIQFNKSTSGWIDFETMKFEEIISEN